MGKTRVISQKKEETIKEVDKISEKIQKVQLYGPKRRAIKGRAYIQITFNNTIITVTDDNGKPMFWSSAGSIGFRGPKKATPYAATKIISVLLEKMKKIGLKELEIYVKGIGPGREASLRAFAGSGIEINGIRDITPIPFNGPKPPKPRRV